jgi:hypothetical protein
VLARARSPAADAHVVRRGEVDAGAFKALVKAAVAQNGPPAKGTEEGRTEKGGVEESRANAPEFPWKR